MFDVYSNQPTECFNWVCVPTRKKNRLTLMKSIKHWFLWHQVERQKLHRARLAADRFHVKPYAQGLMQQSILHLPSYRCIPAIDEGLFLVETLRAESQFRVELNVKKCTCGRIFDLQIPCTHALKAITSCGLQVEDHVHTAFLTTTANAAYGGPLVHAGLVADTTKYAPQYKIQAGRPKKRRQPSRGSRLSTSCTKKNRAPIKCGVYVLITRHNNRTCRGVSVSIVF